MLQPLLCARDDRRRSRAVADMHRREQQLRPAYKLWGYKNVFAKGFIATRGTAAPKPVERWQTTPVGDWHVHLDPVLEHRAAASASAAVLVLGQAFDDRGPAGRDRVADRILRAATGHAHPGAATRALDEVMTWLSGRFVVLVARGDRLDVWGDPLASRSLFWHDGPHGIALASHSALLAELAGGLPNERMRWVLGHADYRSPAGQWLPGLVAPHDDVDQLFANQRVTIDRDGARSERFWPCDDRVELTADEAGERVLAELRQQVRNWISVAPVTALSLTAGRDSRAILTAGLTELQAADALTLTYHPFHNAAKSTYGDLHAAARLSAAARLPHLGIDVPAMRPGSAMAALYERTFPTWRRYANLAHALYVQAPARAATLLGIGGAIITGMYRDTSDPHLTPALLARKYTESPFRDDPELHAELERWMHRVDFTTQALRGYDFYDLFHWEHRMTKWAGYGYSEYDLATIPAPVLSSRRLLVAALSLPKQQRVDAEVYRYIAEGPAPPPTEHHSTPGGH